MDVFFYGMLIIIVLFAPLILALSAVGTTSALKRQVEALDAQVRTLSRRLSALGGPEGSAAEVESAPSAPVPESAPSTPQPQTVTPAPPRQVAPPPEPTPTVVWTPRAPSPVLEPGAATTGKTQSDLERLIGGKWLSWIGILALLLATAFFLKYAFDNNWIGPIGRIAIGFLSGAALMVYSQWLFKKTYVYFSEGIAGLGAGVLYLSLYAAFNVYHLIPNVGALAGMVLVTVALLGFALARDSQRIAVLALVGGFITPLLLNTGEEAEVALFTYLAVLNAGLLWVAYVRNWRALPLAFIFTVFYFWAWYGDHYDPSRLNVTLAFATLFFVEFAVLPTARALKIGSLYTEQVTLVLLNAGWYVLMLHVSLFEQHRWALSAAVIVLAIGHLIVAQGAAPPAQGRPLARVLFSGLALTLVTLAIPIGLRGTWITIGWAIEGAVLVWSGFVTETQWLRVAGVALFALVVARLLVAPIEGGQLIFNQRFGTFATVIACFAMASYLAASRRAELALDERTLFLSVQVAINVLALWALSAEVLDRPYTIAETQQLLLTLVWTLYAAALLVLGIRSNSSLLRWQGLVLLGISIGKVFLVDLSELGLGLRILSFMALGIVLLGISFLYQKRLQPKGSEKEQ